MDKPVAAMAYLAYRQRQALVYLCYTLGLGVAGILALSLGGHLYSLNWTLLATGSFALGALLWLASFVWEFKALEAGACVEDFFKEVSRDALKEYAQRQEQAPSPSSTPD